MPTDLPHVARVAIEGTFNSERFVNVMHFLNLSLAPITDAELGVLLGILDDASTDNDALLHLYSIFDSGVLIDTITATTLSNDAPVQRAATVALAGTSGGNDMPPMLAATVKWSTSVANRRSRGRTFFCGLNVGMVQTANSDRLDTTWAASLAARATDWVNAWVASSTWAFIILSETERQADFAVPFEEVTSASVNPLVTVQRRRRERLG